MMKRLQTKKFYKNLKSYGIKLQKKLKQIESN